MHFDFSATLNAHVRTSANKSDLRETKNNNSEMWEMLKISTE